LNRAIAVFLGAFLGAVLAVAVFTAYLSLSYPNNERDSGLPNVAVALILAAPVGLVLGGVIGAVVPLKGR
jgi:hypothetical protein